ncbi:hypothetical protein IF084_16615, partial [Myroides odoratimimus]|nr:hypothetical protein [Myroides odoratimimus]
IYNGKDLVYKDKDGNDQTIDLDKLVKANETVTTLVAGADGTYTYKSEDGTETKIDIVGDVQENFSKIVENQNVKSVIENISKNAVGNVLFDGVNFTYKDVNGDIQKVDGDFFKQTISGVLYDIIYLQGTSVVKVPVGSTRDVPGLKVEVKIPKGQKKVLLFTISGAVRADTGSGSSGQGIFSLHDETGQKITSGYTNFTDIVGGDGRLLNAPMGMSMQKQVIVDNISGTQDLVKTYTIRYTAWATRPSNTDHVVNFIPSTFAGYQNDTEALLSKMSILIFNM